MMVGWKGKAWIKRYDVIANCSSENSRFTQTVVTDLDGSLMRGRSSFPYFMLLAFEGGGIIRATLLLLLAPCCWFLYHCVSEEAGIRLLIFVSCVGLREKEIQSVARAVLPKFYSEDVHSETWRVVSSFGKRYLLTATPRIMVEPFAVTYLGVDKVLGTELHVTKSGIATGLLMSPGVLLGKKKAAALRCEFGDTTMPDVGIGDRLSDHPFLSLCKVSSTARKSP
jgi:glycerol-3-phosphate acyltransferase